MRWKDRQLIQKAVASLSEPELRSYAGFLLAQIRQLKEHPESMEEAVASLIEVYDELLGLEEKRSFWDPTPDCATVHMVCGDSFAGTMKLALKRLGRSETDKVITLRDNYAVGPLAGLDTPEGRKARWDWFRDHIAGWDEEEPEEEYRELLEKTERIPAAAQAVVWTTRNAREHTAMLHAFSLLSGKPGLPVTVLDACALSEELFNRPDASMFYLHSGELSPDKLVEALRQTGRGWKPSPADREAMVKEWRAVTGGTGTLRIWREGTVVEVPDDYFDAYLLERLDGLEPPADDDGFLKAARLVGEAIGYCDQYMGDSFWEYRIRELVYAGVLDIRGVPAAMRFYRIRRKRKDTSL